MLVSPPIVTPDGNIELHNQSSAALTLSFTDSVGAVRDVSARTFYFETSNNVRVLLTNGGSTNQKILTIAQHALDLLVGKTLDFVVVDETDALHVIEWLGQVGYTGWDS